MVKRLLTRAAYPMSLVVASLHVTVAILAALDRLPPNPSTALLSAQEAKDRLRGIVEDFFFRRLRTEAGKRIRRLLGKTPSSLGRDQSGFGLPVSSLKT